MQSPLVNTNTLYYKWIESRQWLCYVWPSSGVCDIMWQCMFYIQILTFIMYIVTLPNKFRTLNICCFNLHIVCGNLRTYIDHFCQCLREWVVHDVVYNTYTNITWHRFKWIPTYIIHSTVSITTHRQTIHAHTRSWTLRFNV